MRNKKLFSIIMLLAAGYIFCFSNLVYAAAGSKTTKITMHVGQSRKYGVSGVNDPATVVWSSSDPKVVSVTSEGLVTAKKTGSCTVKAKVGKETYRLKIQVKKKGSSIVPMKKLAKYSYFRRYMSLTQMKKAYNIAYKMLLPLEGLSREDQIIGVASALREYFNKGMSYSMKAAHYNDPYGYLVLKRASCAGCVRTTGMLLNMLGIKYEHVNENKYSHQWARVKVGKKYWICDAYGLYAGPEPGVRKHPYMR